MPEARTKQTAPEEKFSNSRQIPFGMSNPTFSLFRVTIFFSFQSFKITSKLPLSATKNSC